MVVTYLGELGEMKPLASAKTVTLPWTSTKASSALPGVMWPFWIPNLSVVAESGDICKIGSWVAIHLEDSNVSLFFYMSC
jgi:hypothetical protein